MKKGIEWAKSRIKNRLKFEALNDREIGFKMAMEEALEILKELDEPTPQLSGKNKLRNQVGRLINDRRGEPDEKSRIEQQAYLNVHHLIDQLDEPEVLSQEFIDKNVVHVRGLGDIIEAEAVENLLVPKQELPMIPKFVAEWIEKCKEENKMLSQVYSDLKLSEVNVIRWLYHEGDRSEKVDLLARAWLDGYEVEETKYRVKLPDKESNATAQLIALRKTEDNRVVINKVKYKTFLESKNVKLTEEEIKRNHEYLWPFAVPVEEEEE